KGNEEDRAAAREHYKRGTKLFDVAKYDDAIGEFTEAYELWDSDDPKDAANAAILLFNIAQAHRLANHYAQAILFYRNYLRKDPKARNRADVEKRIAELEQLDAQQKRVATVQPEAVPPRPEQRPSSGGARPPAHEPERHASTPP